MASHRQQRPDDEKLRELILYVSTLSKDDRIVGMERDPDSRAKVMPFFSGSMGIVASRNLDRPEFLRKSKRPRIA